MSESAAKKGRTAPKAGARGKAAGGTLAGARGAAATPNAGVAAASPATEDAARAEYERLLAAARARFAEFVEGSVRGRRAVVLHDSDADGITAGVVLQRALERAATGEVARVVPDRERSAWTEGNRARVLSARPEALFVLDLGSADEEIAAGVPTCLVDHHRPEGVPPGATLLSAYEWPLVPNTSLLVYELAGAIAGVEDLEWVACVGTLSDLGERAPFEIVARAKKRYGAKWLKEATALVNAARRAASYDPEAAARTLLAHDGPRGLVECDSLDAMAMRAAREEVKAALAEAKRAAPVFSGRVALVRVNSRAQIHPLVAQIWRSRLPGYFVFVANEGYLPGRVNFSARSGAGESVLDFLKAIELSGEGGSYARGHDQASGGSLPVARWNELLSKLGFPEGIRARG